MMTVKDIAELATQSGKLTEPELVKVAPQVRTGVMFPLPDWFEAPKDGPDPRRGEKQG